MMKELRKFVYRILPDYGHFLSEAGFYHVGKLYLYISDNHSLGVPSWRELLFHSNPGYQSHPYKTNKADQPDSVPDEISMFRLVTAQMATATYFLNVPVVLRNRE